MAEQLRLSAALGLSADTLAQLRRTDRLRMLGRLTAGVVHDLGTPLNVVVGRARMIESGELAGDQVTRSARVIAEQADRMSASMRRLMEYVRGRSAPDARTRLGEVLEGTLALLEPMLRKRRVRVAVPPEAAAVGLPGDASDLQQVFANLLVNAIDAMPSGGTVEVDAGPSRAPEGAQPFVCVGVRDEGVGIPEEILPQIFQPFFSTRDEDGAGLGLTVCEGIVLELGGWMEVESRPGEGSRFEVHLPGGGPP